ncbi:MAG TPA: HAD hydrolase-like protein [Bacillota bacterium]|nr:HAD hydrolase-like protein [Bacillota bacterium]
MFKMILFDVDGVLLSEERYFDASALTVWEMLFSPNYLGLENEAFTPTPQEEQIRSIRKVIFDDDFVLSFMKSRGINANWDMVFLSFGHQLISIMEQLLPEHKEELKEILAAQITKGAIDQLRALVNGKNLTVQYDSFVPDFSPSKAEKQELLLYLNHLAEQRLGITTEVFSRTSALWELCQETFQEWYLGETLTEESLGRPAIQKGKKGFLSDEIPIVEPKRMAEVFAQIKSRGITLGIGTGRPTIETLVPLEAMGLLSYFDPNRVITASHVLEAENKYPERSPLAKPQPFCYIKGWLGLDQSDSDIFNFVLPMQDADELLIVGDSIADYMAAKSIGCRFAAILTGLTGQEARAKFEELHADYIFDDMTGILSIFKDN